MLRTITSNIRFDNPADGKHSWSDRKEILTKALLGKTPHLIATQEGREPQLRELELLLKDYRISDSHRGWIKERMYPCLYFNSKKVNILKSGDIWLSQTPQIEGSSSFGSSFPRLATWAFVRIKEKELLVANLHLDHEDEETRIKQVKVFIEEIKKSTVPKAPLIILGDFNSSPGGPVHKQLLKNLELQDPWIELNKKEQSSYHQFKGSIENGKRIDWILHSKQLMCECIELDKINSDGIYPSDHFPIIAEFSFTS